MRRWERVWDVRLGVGMLLIGLGAALLLPVSRLVGILLVVGGVLFLIRAARTPHDSAPANRPIVALTLAVRNLSDLKQGELPFLAQNIGSVAARFVRIGINKIALLAVKCDVIDLLLPQGPPVRVTGKAFVGDLDMAEWDGIADLSWIRASMAGVVRRLERGVAFRVTIDYEDPHGVTHAEVMVLYCSRELDLQLSRR